MFYLIFICFTTLLCPAIGEEGEKSETGISREFCRNLNLEILAYEDFSRSTILVTFSLTESVFKGCCRSFTIYLLRGNETAYSSTVVLNDMDRASHEFENVTFGVYSMYVDAVYNDSTDPTCPRVRITHPLLNMSSEALQQERTNDLPVQTYEKRTVIIIIVTSVILLLVITGLIYLVGRIKRHRSIPHFEEVLNRDSEEDNNAPSNVEVYIFHYYDGNKKIKQKVKIIEDFLLKSSYFSRVEGIEDQLAVILFDVNQWLNDVLDEKEKNGTIKKIILITSQVEDEPRDDDNDVLENVIYAAFIKKLNNNMERCLTGYDNLFVVQLDGAVTCCDKLKDIVRRDRYSLAGESVQDHMVDLCLNLCSGLKLDMCQVEERIKELLSKHPVKCLGNSKDFV